MPVSGGPRGAGRHAGGPPRPHPRGAGTAPRATRRPRPAWRGPRGGPASRTPSACAPAGVCDWACGTPGGGHTPPSPAHPQACGLGTGSHPVWPLARAASGPVSRPGPCSRTGRQTGAPHAPACVQPHRARDMMFPCGDSRRPPGFFPRAQPLTPGVSRCRKPERRRSGGCRQSAARLC